MDKYIFNYNQYKKSINKKPKNYFSLIFIIIIILLGLCIFLYPKNYNYEKMYFVEIDNFNTYKDANKLANLISNKGGAGYVFYDGKYRVLASFYSNYDNAKKVSENLNKEYKNVSILTVENTKFTPKKQLNKHQNSQVKIVLKTTFEALLKLEKLNLKLDKKTLSENELKLHIKNINDNFQNIYSSFLSYFKNDSKFNIAKKYLNEIKNSMSTLTADTITSSILRYENIKIGINRNHFLTCF